MKHTLFFFLSCLMAAVFLSGCGRITEPVSRTEFYFDTVISITLYDGADFSKEHTTRILDDCFSQCARYETLFSRSREGSDVWKINHSQGKPVTVSDDTIRLTKEALSFCAETDGLFDITIAPLSDLWDFSSAKKDRHTVPSPEARNRLLPLIDYRFVQFTEHTVTLSKENAALDFGGVAKGYIADRLKEFLLSEGVTSALINLGGNVLTIGKKPDGSPFLVGIQKPFSDTGDSVAVVPIEDASLVSSGIYERYFETDGKRYHHILNPKTGMPVQNDLLSVTILSPDSTKADALSTACFLMGLKDGLSYIETLPDVEALFITKDYALHATSGMESLIQ